ARVRGVRIITGGHPIEIKGLEGGWFYEPTLLADLDQEDPLVQEEVFGPVLAIQIVESVAEALHLANATAFGLVAGVYTRDISRALQLARDIDAGQIF